MGAFLKVGTPQSPLPSNEKFNNISEASSSHPTKNKGKKNPRTALFLG
jgi:hypothetical protein